MSYAKRVLTTSILFSLMKYLSFLVGLVGQIYLARLILPEEFVPVVLAISILEIIFAFGEFGFNNAILSNQDEKNIFGTSFFFIILLILTLLIFVFIAAHFYSTNSTQQVILLLAPAKALTMLSVVYSTYLEKDFKHTTVGATQVGAKCAGTMGAIYLANNDFGTGALIFKEVAYSSFYFFVLFLFVGRKFNYTFSRTTAGKILSFSISFFLLRVTEVAIKNLPIIFLGRISALDSTYYEKSYYLGGLPNTFLAPVNAKVSYAFYSKVKGEFKRISKGVFLNLYCTFRLLLPVTIISYIYSNEIILLIYGENWSMASDYLKGFSLYMLFAPLGAICKFVLISQDRIKSVIKNRLFSLFSIIFFLFFLDRFEVYHLAWVLSIVSLFSFVHYLWVMNEFIQVDFKKIMLVPTCSLLASSFCFYSDLYFVYNSIALFFLYFVLIFLAEKTTIKNILGMLK